MPGEVNIYPLPPQNSAQPGLTRSLLYGGSKFRGHQKSKGNSYDVEVELQVMTVCCCSRTNTSTGWLGDVSLLQMHVRVRDFSIRVPGLSLGLVQWENSSFQFHCTTVGLGTWLKEDNDMLTTKLRP